MKAEHTPRYLQQPSWNASAIALFSFVIYLRTLAPTVSFIDSGELAAVACTLGVAHPTGYPLFTLLGWVFSKLPIAGEEIVRLNIMSAFLCSAGVFFFYHVVYDVLDLVTKRTSIVQRAEAGHRSILIALSSTSAALMLAFSETYWSQGLGVEVYSLHVLFLSLVTYCFMRAAFASEVRDPRDDGRAQNSSRSWWLTFAFVLGLSFTNHMTTILLAPGLLYLYFATQGISATSWKRIGIMGIPFLLGLSLYLYLPIRASQSPTLNWGNTATLERFLWHLSGKQYRVWIFSSTEAAGRQMDYFLSSFPAEFAYVGLILSIIGLSVLWRGHRKLFVGVMLLFLTCVFYSINYDIHDIDSYFLLAYFSTAILAGCGLLAVISRVSRPLKWKMLPIGFLAICIGLVPCFYHFTRVDERNNYLVEDYTMNMFASFERNAVVFSYQWDFWVSASYYYQLVRNFRQDVAVIDKELLRRSWYFKELEARFPWLLEGSRREVDSFLKELHKFEQDRPYNPAIIQARFVEMISSFIQKSLKERPVYVTQEIEPEFTRGLHRVPDGLALRVVADTLTHSPRVPDFHFRPFQREGRLETRLKGLYAEALVASGMYLMRKGSEEEAQKAFAVAEAFKLGRPRANQRLGGSRK